MSQTTKQAATGRSRNRSDTETALAVAQQIMRLCGAGPPDRPALNRVLTELRQLVAFDAASLYLLDRRQQRLVEVGTVGGAVAPLDFLKVGDGDGLSGWVASQRKPVLLTNRPTGPVDQPTFATLLSLPLSIGDDVIGVVNLGCEAAEAIDPSQVKQLSFIVDVIALSVERQQYAAAIARSRRTLDDIRSQLDSTVKSSVSPETLVSLGELAAGVNHAINNPLAVIVGNVQFLLHENVATNQKTLSRLRRIEQAALQISDTNRELVRLHSMTHRSAEQAAGPQSTTKE